MQPVCHPARDQIPSGTCHVPLKTWRHNPLKDRDVPVVHCVRKSVSPLCKSQESTRASWAAVFLPCFSRRLGSGLFPCLCICSIWCHWSKPPAGPGLAWSHLPPERSLFVGRRPIMEMIQQLFKLQISFRFSVRSPVSLCLSFFFFFLKLSSLKPCHQHLSYLPGGSANSIRGTCLTNALPLSVSVSFTALAICGVACLAPHFLLCDRYPHSVALRCPAGCPCRRWSLARL